MWSRLPIEKAGDRRRGWRVRCRVLADELLFLFCWGIARISVLSCLAFVSVASCGATAQGGFVSPELLSMQDDLRGGASDFISFVILGDLPKVATEVFDSEAGLGGASSEVEASKSPVPLLPIRIDDRDLGFANLPGRGGCGNSQTTAKDQSGSSADLVDWVCVVGASGHEWLTRDHFIRPASGNSNDVFRPPPPCVCLFLFDLI